MNNTATTQNTTSTATIKTGKKKLKLTKLGWATVALLGTGVVAGVVMALGGDSDDVKNIVG